MNRIKQLFAIILIILLISLYVITLVFAIMDNTSTMSMFAASVLATIIIPVLLWAYTFIYKLVNKKSDSENDNLTK